MTSKGLGNYKSTNVASKSVAKGRASKISGQNKHQSQ